MEATWMVELLQLIKLSLKDQVEMMMIVTENVVVTHVIAIVAEIMEVVEGLMVVNAFSVANLVILQGNVLVKEEKEGYGGAGKVDIAVAMSICSSFCTMKLRYFKLCDLWSLFPNSKFHIFHLTSTQTLLT
jgi:hypothetical protein